MQAENPDQKYLPENNELYRNMIENSRDGICITQNGLFRFMNKAFGDLIGYQPELLVGTLASDILHEKDKDRMVAQHYQRMAGLRTKDIDYTSLKHKNGCYIDIEYTATAIDYMGTIASFITARDITERNRMQEKLEQSEHKYRNLVENAHDGIIITQFGKFKFVNKAFCNIIEYTEEELIESDFLNIVADEEKVRLQEYHRLRMAGEKHQMIYEAKGITKTGKLVYFEINTSYIDYNGFPATFIILRDHTEHKLMEETLKESESKYRTLIEKSLDGIVISQDGKVKLVNKAFADMIGYTVEECMQTFGPASIAPEDQERVMKIHYSRMKGEVGDMRYNASIICKNGEKVIAEFNSTTIEINGRIASFITTRDITQQLKMQQALEQSAQKYRDLAEMLPQTVYEHDNQGNLTYLNQAGKQKFGITNLEPTISAYSLVVPEDLDRMEHNRLKSLSDKTASLANTYTAIKTNGEKFPVMIFASPIVSDGKWIGVRGIVLDMTDHFTIENALRESEKKYRDLAEMLPQTVFELDLGGNVTYLNKAGRFAFGLSENDIGFQATTGIIHEDHERLLDNIRKAFVEKGRDGGMEYTALRRDGATFPIVIYSTPMAENNEIKGIRGLIVDISERKAMEEALRKSEEHYRHVIQSLQEGLFVLQDEKFRFVNDAIVDILGYTVEEMTGKHFSTVIPPELRDEAVRKNFRRKSGHADSWSYEFRLLHKDGKTRIPVILSTNLTELDGKTAVVGTAKDITDRIKAEEEIKSAHKRLEKINQDLEQTIRERTKELTKANTQLLKLQKENLQSQFDVLKQQVNPHFLFNSLNVLTSLIRLEPELAEKFTEHLAKVYRYVLENKDNELVTLSTELGFLDAYIFLIKIRFMDKVVVNIRIPNERKNYKIIPLAMQLLIENAIKHNAMSKKSPLVIDIYICNNNQLCVMNNLQEREAHMVSTGVGLKNIQNRYRLLNNTVPVFEKTETHFMAQIPLVAE